MAGAFWCARRIDQQQARAAAILAKGTEQQERADRMQTREEELLVRWAALLARLEVLAERLERQSRA
jgi:hypothetical protein